MPPELTGAGRAKGTAAVGEGFGASAVLALHDRVAGEEHGSITLGEATDREERTTRSRAEIAVIVATYWIEKNELEMHEDDDLPADTIPLELLQNDEEVQIATSLDGLELVEAASIYYAAGAEVLAEQGRPHSVVRQAWRMSERLERYAFERFLAPPSELVRRTTPRARTRRNARTAPRRARAPALSSEGDSPEPPLGGTWDFVPLASARMVAHVRRREAKRAALA